MPDFITPKEFADKIRQRRPDLADRSDADLVNTTIQAIPELEQYLHPAGRPSYIRETSRQQFEINQPESSLYTRARAASRQLGTEIQGAAEGLATMAGARGPMAQMDMLANTPSAIGSALKAPYDWGRHLYSGDYDAASADSVRMLTQTVPTIAGIRTGMNAASPLVRRAKSAVTRNVTAPMINTAMNIPARLRAANIDPGQRLIEDKFVGGKEAALAHMKSGMDKLSPQIEHKLAMDSPNTTINAQPIIDAALSNAEKTLIYGSDPAFQTRLHNIRASIAKEYPNLDHLSPRQIQNLKSYIHDNIKFDDTSNVPHEQGINDALGEMYSGLQKQLGDAIPSVKSDLAKWGDYEVGAKAIDASINADRFRQSSMLQSLKQATLGSMPVRTAAGRLFRSSMPTSEQPVFSDRLARDPITREVLTGKNFNETGPLLPGTRTRNPTFQVPENQVSDLLARDPITGEISPHQGTPPYNVGSELTGMQIQRLKELVEAMRVNRGIYKLPSGSLGVRQYRP